MLGFAALIAVFAPLVGLPAAVALSWGWAFTWVALELLLGTYLLTALGIIVGDRQAERDERCVDAQADH